MEDFLAYVVALDAERLLNTSHQARRAVARGSSWSELARLLPRK
jgi:hypothetical protein